MFPAGPYDLSEQLAPIGGIVRDGHAGGWISMVRLYEENEVHRCNNCGLQVRVSYAAVPIEPVTCCGADMDLLGIFLADEGLDLTPKTAPANALPKVYMPGELYNCSICGLDVTILVQAQPSKPLDCCGEGMEKR